MYMEDSIEWIFKTENVEENYIDVGQVRDR
jgi:hypothetical protein